MARKDWKQKETKAVKRWRSLTSQDEIYISKYPYKDKIYYGVMVYRPNGVDRELGSFKTKSKAIAKANAYMRSH